MDDARGLVDAGDLIRIKGMGLDGVYLVTKCGPEGMSLLPDPDNDTDEEAL